MTSFGCRVRLVTGKCSGNAAASADIQCLPGYTNKGPSVLVSGATLTAKRDSCCVAVPGAKHLPCSQRWLCMYDSSATRLTQTWRVCGILRPVKMVLQEGPCLSQLVLNVTCAHYYNDIVIPRSQSKSVEPFQNWSSTKDNSNLSCKTNSGTRLTSYAP